MKCTICGQQAEPDGQLQCECSAALPPVRSEPLLAPCPFCGNVPQLLFRSTGFSDLARPIISCPGPCEMKEVTTGLYDRAEECVAAWNRRANAAGQPPAARKEASHE